MGSGLGFGHWLFTEGHWDCSSLTAKRGSQPEAQGWVGLSFKIALGNTPCETMGQVCWWTEGQASLTHPLSVDLLPLILLKARASWLLWGGSGTLHRQVLGSTYLVDKPGRRMSTLAHIHTYPLKHLLPHTPYNSTKPSDSSGSLAVF